MLNIKEAMTSALGDQVYRELKVHSITKFSAQNEANMTHKLKLKLKKN